MYAETAVSMKTTIITDVNIWLNSKPIRDNISFLRQGIDKTKGIMSNSKKMVINKAEMHIYVPKENMYIKDEWLNTLGEKYSEIEFKIDILENYIK